MITVHHLENSRSLRILWLLEELGLDYDVVRHTRNPRTLLAPAALRAVHPLGKAPVVVLDDGQVLVESGAIVEGLLARFDPGHALSPPPDSPDSDRYRQWLHYAEGSAMPLLLLSLVFSRIRSAPMPFFVRPVARSVVDRAMSGFVAPQLRLHLDYMEAELGRSRWFVGDAFSAADIQMSFPVEGAAARGGLDAHPRLAAFLERIHARPAYARALERGGPFKLS